MKALLPRKAAATEAPQTHPAPRQRQTPPLLCTGHCRCAMEELAAIVTERCRNGSAERLPASAPKKAVNWQKQMRCCSPATALGVRCPVSGACQTHCAGQGPAAGHQLAVHGATPLWPRRPVCPARSTPRCTAAQQHSTSVQFVHRAACHQLRQCLGRVQVAVQQRHHGFADGHVHPQGAGTLHHGARAVHAFGHMAQRGHGLR